MWSLYRMISHWLLLDSAQCAKSRMTFVFSVLLLWKLCLPRRFWTSVCVIDWFNRSIWKPLPKSVKFYLNPSKLYFLRAGYNFKSSQHRNMCQTFDRHCYTKVTAAQHISSLLPFYRFLLSMKEFWRKLAQAIFWASFLRTSNPSVIRSQTSLASLSRRWRSWECLFSFIGWWAGRLSQECYTWA